MAIAASAVWRVRPGGNAANGGAYDGTSYPGGTDYTQQDAAQASWANLSCTGSGSTTLTDASSTGLFTAAMVGNAIQITGGTGFNAGWYFVVSRTSTNAVVLDSSPASSGAATGGSGKLGGALASFRPLLNGGRQPYQGAVGGNTIWVRGSGTDFPATADYTWNDGLAWCGGGSSNLLVAIIGENGRPRIDTNNSLYGGQFYHLENLQFRALASLGYGFFEAGNSVIRNVIFDCNGYDTPLIGASSGLITECEFYSSTPVTGTWVSALLLRSPTVLAGCHFHNLPFHAITFAPTASAIICNNVVANCGGDGISTGSNAYSAANYIFSNTITRNGGHGIRLDEQSEVYSYGPTMIFGNLITDHVTAGKSGLAVLTGTAADNSALAWMIGANTFFNNATNVSGINLDASSVVLGASPFTNPATQDWSITGAAKGNAAWPKTMMQHLSGMTALLTLPDPGAVQGGTGGGSTPGIGLTRGEFYGF